jgi:hypothetical protein
MCHACISREKNEVMHIRFNYDLSEKNFKKPIGYLNSSQKNTLFQKINRLKWSLRSEVMSILKSTNFHFFFRKWPCNLKSFIQSSHGMGFGSCSLKYNNVDICIHLTSACTSSDLYRDQPLKKNLRRA